MKTTHHTPWAISSAETSLLMRHKEIEKHESVRELL